MLASIATVLGYVYNFFDRLNQEVKKMSQNVRHVLNLVYRDPSYKNGERSSNESTSNVNAPYASKTDTSPRGCDCLAIMLQRYSSNVKMVNLLSVYFFFNSTASHQSIHQDILLLPNTVCTINTLIISTARLKREVFILRPVALSN